MLVTASERGTVLRLFETGLVKRGHGAGGSRDATEETTGKPIREFRRGVERATVTCLSFSLDNSWLACCSDHGTVHVFRCWDNEGSDNAKASGSTDSKKKKSKPAFDGAAFDKDGNCTKHKSVQLAEQVTQDGRVLWKEIKMVSYYQLVYDVHMMCIRCAQDMKTVS